VEVGNVTSLDEQNEFDLLIGKYLVIFSHSGSRGIGANIVRYYTGLAMGGCHLPSEAKHLAWMDLCAEIV